MQTEYRGSKGGILSLTLQCPAEMTDPHLIARRDALDKVDVHTYPYVLEALRVFEKYGLKQGGGAHRVGKRLRARLSLRLESTSFCDGRNG